MAKKKLTKQQILEAIEATAGKTTGICRRLNVTRATLGRYMKQYPELVEAVEFAKDELLDLAEFELLAAVKRGEAWAVQLTLKDSKRGRERGYGNALDVTSGGKALNGVIRVIEHKGDDSDSA
jgi:hypothetical protein